MVEQTIETLVIWDAHDDVTLMECTKCVKLTKRDLVIGILGAVSIRKTVLPGMAIPMLKIRRPNDRLIFNMEIAIRR